MFSINPKDNIMTVKLEYVWLDGHTQKNLRSKIRFEEMKLNSKGSLNIKDIPRWSFDGSSTQQASSDNSDLILKPVKVVKNPLSNKNEQYRRTQSRVGQLNGTSEHI